MSSVQTSRARVLIAPVSPAGSVALLDPSFLVHVDGTSPPPYQSVDTWPANGQAPLRRRSPSSLTCTPLQPLAPLSGRSDHSASPTHPTYTRPRSRTAGDSSLRPRRTPTRPRSRTNTEMSVPDSSPPPYSPSPVQRASSSPHLRGTPPLQLFTYSHPPSSSSLASQSLHHRPPSYSPATRSADTSGEDADDTATSDDGMIFTVPPLGVSGSLRSRLLKRKTRTHDGAPARPISTSHGVPGAGETETESEDSPHDLPTARIITSSAASPFSPTWSIHMLFFFSRLLSIVPAVFGMLWNLYHVIWPPVSTGPDALRWRVDYSVSILWSILTGWQCLQLTTGLLKRWRVYYSPLPTLIRLLALQAICWPATHLTLSVLNHEARPALCWAVIGTTTCYSRSIQLWVTSNIGPAPAPPAPAAAAADRSRPAGVVGQPSPLRQSVLARASGMREEWMRLRRRRWDWGAVGRKCVLPAGIVYFVMAWAEMLRREWERAGPGV